MSNPEFYICKKCQNIVELLQHTGPTPVCCGDEMDLLVAGSTDAALEKHVPVAVVSGGLLEAKVGSVTHPMEDDHWIQWIYVQLEDGSIRKVLNPGDAPEAVFALGEADKAVAVYEYCNKHGLWKTDL
jgi:superoxide reductase